ncbi:hypothetical protein NEFER03_0728 [Nematocida sp. LUAm3]|nr:hypothetical protein NEFER03_0728 [Nematocida sp. LUAm3]KAI5175187.1 hypothetical protein NEFER02_1148 [Nematocida sp. LUAm2]KAI5178141.1 hypothetical protein NEFER01_1319 [Nematocida sp. LUAm1]
MREIKEKQKIWIVLLVCLALYLREAKCSASTTLKIDNNPDLSSHTKSSKSLSLEEEYMDDSIENIPTDPVILQTINLFVSTIQSKNDELLRVSKASRSFGVLRKDAEEENIKEYLKYTISSTGVTTLPQEKQIIQKLLDQIRKERLSNNQNLPIKSLTKSFLTNYTAIRSVLRENRALHRKILRETLQSSESSGKFVPEWIQTNLATRTKAIFGYVKLIYDILEKVKDTIKIRSTPDAILLIDLLSDMFDNLTEEVYEEGNEPYNHLMRLLSNKIIVYITEENMRMNQLIGNILSNQNITNEMKETHKKLEDILLSIKHLKKRLDPSVSPEVAMGIVDKTGTRLIIDEYTTQELKNNPSVTAFKMEISNILGSTDISIFRQRLYNLMDIKKKTLEYIENNQITRKHITKEYIKRICAFYRELSRIPYKLKYFSILGSIFPDQESIPTLEITENQFSQVLSLMRHITEWNLDTHDLSKVLDELDASYENLIHFYHQYMDKVLVLSMYLDKRKEVEDQINKITNLFRSEKGVYDKLTNTILLCSPLDTKKDASPEKLSQLVDELSRTVKIEVNRAHTELIRHNTMLILKKNSLKSKFLLTNVLGALFKRKFPPLPLQYSLSIANAAEFLQELPTFLEQETQDIKGTHESIKLYRDTLIYLLPIYARINALLTRISQLEPTVSRSPYISMLRDELRLIDMLHINTLKFSYKKCLLSCSSKRKFFNTPENIRKTLIEIFAGLDTEEKK